MNIAGHELARMLATDTSLRTLDVTSYALGEDGVGALCEAIADSPAPLETLFFCGNGAGPGGARHLAALLARRAGLRGVFFAGNEIGDEGARHLAAALRHAPDLRMLGLSSNGIGPDGALALADALRQNRSLWSLDLRGADVGEPGAEALVSAASEHPEITEVLLDGPLPSHLRARLVLRLARNRNRRRPTDDDRAFEAAVRAVRSAYRPAPRVPRHRPSDAPDGRLPAVMPDEAAIAQCLATLRAVASLPPTQRDLPDGVSELRDLCERVVSNARQAARAESNWRRSLRTARDLERLEETGIRRLRRGAMEPPPAEPPAAPSRLEGGRNCYICKGHYRVVDAFYDQLCPACAAFNRARRERTADLSGRVALVTGGRVKIGQRAALKLLRAGARVIVTTRFPNDAWRRYAAEADFDAWRDRLEIHGLDLRFLQRAERFARDLADRLERLDVLLSNAAQTVARPADWYAEMARLDGDAARALPPGVRAQDPAAWTPSDGLGAELALPDAGPARLDRHAQPVDARAHNSWRAVVGEVSTHELASVHAVTALAPFVLLNALRPVMARDAVADKFVVLVSAVEGQFNRRNKTPRHPHTNMAKAALNMLARTSASDLADDRIWTCAVDTGWITDENPQPIADRMAARGFEPPLDEEDGAARVLDPVLRVMHGAPPVHGVFLKDYEVAPW